MSNKCAICGENGSKGWFNLPSDEEHRRQWIEVIRSRDKQGQEPSQVHKSAKVCYQHFSVDQIQICPKLVKPRPGKKRDWKTLTKRHRLSDQLGNSCQSCHIGRKIENLSDFW